MQCPVEQGSDKMQLLTSLKKLVSKKFRKLKRKMSSLTAYYTEQLQLNKH
jgi:hypothetical protein